MLTLSATPITGDAGLSPIILVLIIICSLIIIGCIVWTILLNRKNANISTTVITISDDEETEPEQTLLEDISQTEQEKTDNNIE